ncbi:flagellar hook-basal body complex protein [Butyrivibrio sp. AE2032]|uniref:flagellar hook-basal body complex protein n=1 Tax=Butyrivibrio sp. AE2032 TaxID=1458463 RepID=UPI00068CA3E1|nr:flagellar hook-basal body complex protein [Butyrivibrio sp. AE2032]
MMRSLYSGVAGLRTHQTKMDVLGNNIANVNTTSFKSQSITFSDLMYQTTQTASGATETKGGVNARQIGLGAKSGAIATAIESQGATQTTNNPFDIMITGKAFFVVNNGKEDLYTRDGSFYVDGAGNLAMQSNGYLVQGWVAQEDKETGEIKVNKNGGLASLQIMSADNATYSPASTTAALYSGNIDDHDTNVTSDDGKTITLEFYDNKGYLYTGKFTLKDTGTDHLFSLQLTDIIDSDGNTINKTLADGTTTLDHIKFGSSESFDYTISDTHEITVGSTSAEIYQKAGTKVYTDVPRTGVLSDLLTSSKTSYAGILNKLYGVTDKEVIDQTNGYSKTSAYSIDDSGKMTITYEKDYVKAKSLNSGFSYKSGNTDAYYVSNGTKGEAYQVPTSTSGTMKDLIAATKATLEKVFGIDSTPMTTYTSDSSYSYTFKTNAGSTADVFTVTKSSTLPATASTAKYEQMDDYTSYDADFMDGSGNLTLKSTTDAYTAAHPGEKLFYSYASGTLKVVGSKVDSTTTTPDKSYSYTGNVTGYTKNALYAASSLTTAQKVELAKVLDNVVTPSPALVVAGDDAQTATNLTTYLNSNGYTHLTFRTITGTSGLELYTSEPSVVEDTTNVVFTGTPFSKAYNAAEGSAATQFTSKTPSTVFKNSSDGSAYVLTGNEAKLGDYNANVLNTVYGIDPTSTAMGYSSTSLVKFSSTGAITIYDNLTANPTFSSDYSTSEGSSDTTISFVTNNPTSAYSNVPLSGNITDLLSTATGSLKDLLNSVYNVSDEDADAFGTDGTYKINNDGSISLSTGSKTVQLVFNAANGALTTANGAKDGMVDMYFDQSIDGLEAFGFQVSNSSDPSEQAKKGTLEVDFSTVTNYNTSGSSTIKAVKGDKKSLNTGRAVGEMNGVTVSTDGQIYATYSNGQTKLLGQIASAEFANASGLSKEGDNLYKSTLNSGDPTVQDITTDGGYMNTGVLEMSNVDLSKEFTEMITTQRGFQANSRIITVSDTLLEELTNLKR